MFIIITLKSKSKNTLKSFFKHFNSINEQLNVNKQLTFYNKKKQTKIFSILKSPHVNKKAQEQFELTFSTKIVEINSFQLLKVLLILKKFQTRLYSDIDIKINFNLTKGFSTGQTTHRQIV